MEIIMFGGISLLLVMFFVKIESSLNDIKNILTAINMIQIMGATDNVPDEIKESCAETLSGVFTSKDD